MNNGDTVAQEAPGRHRPQSLGEEIANSVSHGVGFVAALVAFPFLVIGALQHGYQDMYSQGLQMGQALRNCVLDPANPKAYENLEKARKDFGVARENASRAASSVDGFTSSLARIGPLAQAQAEAQGEVLAALKAGQLEAAKALVNSKETPAWRF